MEIYIDNELLDMPADGGDITETITNIRFCESVLSDDFTTDFDVPLTRKNRRLLGLYTEFYTGHPQRVACVAYKRGERYTAQLTVNSTTETTANVTLFTPVLFASIDNLSLWRLQVDSASTIYKWAEDAAALDTVPFPKYISEKGNFAGCYARHAVATHTDIMQGVLATQGGNLSLDESEFVAVGWDLQDLTVVATKKTVCPQNTRQSLLCIAAAGKTDFSIFGGQHIVNDLECEAVQYSGGLWVPEDYATTITFNRRCNAKITAEVCQENYPEFTADIYLNGSPLGALDCTGTRPSVTQKVTNVLLSAGDELTIKADYQVQQYDKVIMIEIEYSNYTITEADYENELYYLPVSAKWSSWCSIAGIDTTYPHSDWSFSYFGLWCNMPEISIKSYLTTVSWVAGMQYVLEQSPTLTLKLTALSDEAKTIEKHWVESVAMTSSTIGRTNIIRYKDGKPSAILTAEGSELEGEKVIFESEFSNVKATRDPKKGYVPIYEMEQDDEVLDAHNWKVNYEDCEGYLGLLYYNPDLPISSLGTPPALTTMEMQDFVSVVEVKGWTRKDIRRDSSVIIDGLRFALTSVEWDDDTDRFHYTAILTKSAFSNEVQPTQTFELLGIKIGGEFYLIGKKDNSNNYNLIGQK